MCDLLGDEGDEIGGELVDAGVRLNGGQRGILPFGVCLVDQGGGEFGKEFLGLLGQDVFYERLDVDVVEPVGRGEMRVCVGSLWEQVGMVRGSWVLGDGGLDALYGKPVC